MSNRFSISALCMWPIGAKILKSRKAELQRERGELFEILLDKCVGNSMTDVTDSYQFVLEDVDIQQMKGFQAMLQEMRYYIRLPL